ncbi:hypothetical protein RYX36_011357 [Vicia faba]
MALEEYEKLLEEKIKALQALKTEERKVDTKEVETMHALSCKKDNFEIFAKLSTLDTPLAIGALIFCGVVCQVDSLIKLVHGWYETSGNDDYSLLLILSSRTVWFKLTKEMELCTREG